MSGVDARGQRTAAPSDADGHRPAQLGRRVGAYLIDSAIAVVVLLVAAGVFAGIAFSTDGAFPLWVAVVAAYVALAAWFVVYTLLQGGAGSLGMRALGLRLVRAGSGDRLGFGATLGRNVVWWLGGIVVVGMFSPLFDGSAWHRGWHDRASGAVMTDVSGRGPILPLPESGDRAAAAPHGATGSAGSTGTKATDASDAEAAHVPATLASVPTVLPAAPILPRGDDTDLVGWTPGGADAREVRRTPSADGVISFVPGVTDPERYDAPAPEREIDVPVVDAPVAPGASSAAVSTASAPVPPLVLDDPLEQTRLSTGERPVARLVWDDGTQQAVYGRTLFGRNPTPETGAMVSPVRDETLSLSKTHFELAPGDDRALWVIDRHSTNGVTIRRGAQTQAVTPGERTRVRMGDVLEFGDRHVTIEVAS